MTAQEVFILADQALEAVVDQIRDDQWELVVPDDMTRTAGHHAARDHQLPRLRRRLGPGRARGQDDRGGRRQVRRRPPRRPPEAELREHRGDGDARGPRPSTTRTASSTSATATGRRASTSSTSPASAACAPTTSRSSSARTRPCRRTWSRGLWDEIAPSAEEWRKLGVYGPAVPVPEDAPLQDRLLGLTGRRPS